MDRSELEAIRRHIRAYLDQPGNTQDTLDEETGGRVRQWKISRVLNKDGEDLSDMQRGALADALGLEVGQLTEPPFASPRQAVAQAFSPHLPIRDPERFTGRREEIERAVRALRSEGSVPIVCGPRGVGKTSLAEQMMLLAHGDRTLLARLDIEELALRDDEQFLPIYIACSAATTSTKRLLLRMLRYAEVPSVACDAVTEYRRSEFPKSLLARDVDGAAVEDEVLNFVEYMSAEGFPRLLFVVDEFDLAHRPDGFAPFVKSLTDSRRTVKFVIVGIATSVPSLLKGHESLQRHLRPIIVPRMDAAELSTILDSGLATLERAGIEVGVEPTARDRIVEIAGGHNPEKGLPFMVHALGRRLLSRRLQDRGLEGPINAGELQNSVDLGSWSSSDVQVAMESWLGTLEPEFRPYYTTRVAITENHERVAALLAHYRLDDVPEAELRRQYELLGIPDWDTVEVILRDLTEGENPCLMRVASDLDPIRFRDLRFKQYVRNLDTAVNRRVAALWTRAQVRSSGSPYYYDPDAEPDVETEPQFRQHSFASSDTY